MMALRDRLRKIEQKAAVTFVDPPPRIVVIVVKDREQLAKIRALDVDVPNEIPWEHDAGNFVSGEEYIRLKQQLQKRKRGRQRPG